MHRDRHLLNLCHDAPRCFLRVPGVCVDTGHYVPAHSNQQKHGRGLGLKSHDCFAPPACPPCHYWLDYGKDGTREEKEAVFDRGLIEWTVYIWENEKVRVA